MASPALFQHPGGLSAGVLPSIPANLENRTVDFRGYRLDVNFQAMWDIEIAFNDSIFNICRRIADLKSSEYCELLVLSSRAHHPHITREQFLTVLTARDLYEIFLPAFQEAVYKSWYTDFQIKKNLAEADAKRVQLSKMPLRDAVKKAAEENAKHKNAYVDWEGMWSIWHYDFKNPSDFWKSHPCLFYLLLERQTCAQEQHDLRTALLMCQTYNMNRGKGKRVAKPSEFMIQRRPKDEVKQSIDAQVEIAREITMAYGGKIRQPKQKRLTDK